MRARKSTSRLVIENGYFFGLEKFVLDNFKEEEILALKEPILVRNKFLILPTSSRISLSFQSLRVVVDYMEGNQTAEPIIMVVFPLLSLKKGQVNYLNSKGIKAASIGKGKLCKWRLEVVSFISIRATW